MASADILRAAHSELPFEAFDDGVFAGQDCIAVCDTETEGEERDFGNAAFIVRACNAHYQMLEALKEAASALDEQGRRTGLRFPSTEEVIRAAIAAAEAGR